jgi:PAS domain S-box-containing protein
MNGRGKTKEDLLIDLQILDKKYTTLLESLENERIDYKHSKKVLKESEEMFRSFFDKAPLGYQSLDFDGNFIEVNQTWLDTLGYKRGEVIGKWFGDFLTPRYQDGFRKRFPMFKELGSIHSEFEMVHKTGIVHFIAFDGRIGYDTDGKFLQTHCILKDITEQRKTEEALRESEEIFRHFMEHSPIYIFFKDAEIRSVMLSKNYEQMLGKPMNELLGKTMDDLFPSDLAKTMVADDLRILNEGLSTEIEEELNGKHYTTIKFPILKDGKPKYLAGYTIDTTQHKKDEEQISKLNQDLEERVSIRTNQLENANNELESFSYSVSHDLRAPLRAVDGFSKFLLEDYGDKLDQEGKRLLSLIRSNTQRMDRLITDILALSRVTRSVHKVSKIDMSKMVFSMFNECVAPEDRNKLSFTIDPIPHTIGDATYLKQVWSNLILNAVKFSSKKSKPEIHVGGRTENGFNIYFIKDNGAGFNPDYAHKLFAAFQRLHKPDEFEGTGVGLAIVQRVVHRHGGKVWAEGNEGTGATFYFSLPVM